MERRVRAVLIADIVEYVRLVEYNEEDVVARWLDLVEITRSKILPRLGGSIVKNLGDGLLMQFPEPRGCVEASFLLHHIAKKNNTGLPNAAHISLRIGIAYEPVIVRRNDIFGTGVNLASRLSTLAGPGETVVSSTVRDSIADSVDGSIEDMGECYLKHMSRPTRAFRIVPVGDRPKLPKFSAHFEMQPTLAVLPMHARMVPPENEIMGQIISEEVIRSFSKSSEINVISRLSTATLSSRSLTISEIGKYLKADYILSGLFSVNDGVLTVDAEMTKATTESVIWSDRLEGKVADLLIEGLSVCGRIILQVSNAIVLTELADTRLNPLPTLQSYTLLLSAVELMHRLSPRDYEQSRELLAEVINRGNRQPLPHAWMANWHVLKVIQGWSQDLRKDTSLALESSNRALDADPECELALAMNGFVHTHLTKEFDIARARYDSALSFNPNSPVARLLKGTLHAFTDEGDPAVKETEHAMRLSPLDPHRFIFETHCAGAHLSAGNFDKSLKLAESSYRANRLHASTLRIMTTALWELGRVDEASKKTREMLALDPGLTVSGYLRRSPNAEFKVGQRIAKAFEKTGVPL